MAGVFLIVPSHSHMVVRDLGEQSPTALLLSATERTGEGVKGWGGRKESMLQFEAVWL
jgi:hypothetical protein